MRNSASIAIAHPRQGRSGTQPMPSGHGPEPPGQRPRAAGACVPGAAPAPQPPHSALADVLMAEIISSPMDCAPRSPNLSRAFLSSRWGRVHPTVDPEHCCSYGRSLAGSVWVHSAVAGSCEPRSSARGRRAP